MKLWILYSKYYETNAIYSPELMCKAAKEQGLEYELYYFDYFTLKLVNGIQQLFYRTERVTKLPDVVFSRGYYLELLEYLERNGCHIINSYEGMKLVKNKYETSLILKDLKIKQPKTIFIRNSDYDFLVSELGSPFIMKDNFGSQGKGVYLIERKEELEIILNDNPLITFIYQEYIESSRGKDVRFYVVGNKIVGVLKRISQSEDFRANVSQGGKVEPYEVTEELKNQALEIANKLNIEIGSVDFLFGKNSELIFCEANGNAAFSGFIKLNYPMQKIFMEYIKNKYDNFKNIIAQKKELTLKRNSFEVVKGCVPILLSAPHNVEQVREDRKKPLDLGTGHLLLKTINESGAYGIIKTNCVGKIGEVDDDPNYEVEHPYKQKIIELVNKNKIKAVIDIHSLSKDRTEQINLGINGGKNIQNNFELLEKVKALFFENGFYVTIDTPFYAGENTVSANVSKGANIFSLQIEINSKLIHLKDKRNEFLLITEIMRQMIALLNNEL